MLVFIRSVESRSCGTYFAVVKEIFYKSCGYIRLFNGAIIARNNIVYDSCILVSNIWCIMFFLTVWMTILLFQAVIWLLLTIMTTVPFYAIYIHMRGSPSNKCLPGALDCHFASRFCKRTFIIRVQVTANAMNPLGVFNKELLT